DPGIDDVFFDLRRQLEEALVSLLGHKTHDMLDARAVVPAAVEDHDFSRRGKLLDVALHKQLALLPFRRRRQGNDPEYPRTDPFGNCPNGAAFAGSVATLESDDDPQTLLLDPLLQVAELDLKLPELDVIVFALHPIGIVICFGALFLPFAHGVDSSTVDGRSLRPMNPGRSLT